MRVKQCVSVVGLVAVCGAVDTSAQSTEAVGDALVAAVRQCGAIPAVSLVRVGGWQPVHGGEVDNAWAVADSVPLWEGRGSVLDAYSTIVRFHEAPLFVPSEEQEARRKSAESVLLYRRGWVDKVLGRNQDRWQSRRYEAYRLFSRRYAIARDAWEQGPLAGTLEAKEAADAAMEAWTLRGYRVEVQSALGTLASLAELDANSQWAGRARVLNDAVVVGSGRPAVEFSPDVATWIQGDGWSSCGPFQQGGLTLTFELKLVSVRRRWLDSAVFYDRNWRWLESVPRGPDVPVSDGQGLGRLPILPHTLVLIRRATILQENGVRSDTAGVTAVGWIGDRIPLSPNPRPELQWGLPQISGRRRPLLTAVGLFVATSLDKDTFDSTRSVGRHVIGPNMYIQFRFAEWLLVGTGAGPHVRGPGVALAANARIGLGTDLRVLGGVRFWRGADGTVVQGLFGFAMPLWQSKVQ
jgi:hypothetical protein